jgi:hypothetical protein
MSIFGLADKDRHFHESEYRLLIGKRQSRAIARGVILSQFVFVTTVQHPSHGITGREVL